MSNISEFEKLLPEHKASLTLTHNEYKVNYYTIEQGLEDVERYCSVIDRQKILETGEIWELHWYPDTPVGFCSVAASNLTTLLEYVNENNK